MVTIGSLTLRDFEVPQVIRYGGQQRLAVHHLGDGRRIVETLGHDDADIAFGGTLTGPDAAARARILDALCRSATAVPLVWDGYRLTVIVQRFSADYRVETWIDYQVSCSVVDPTPPPRPDSDTARRSQLMADAAAVAVLEPALATSMAALSASAVTAGAFTSGDSANLHLRAMIQAAIDGLGADLASRAILLGYLTHMLASTNPGVTA